MFFSNIMLLTACFMIISCTFDHIISQPDVVWVTSTNAQPYVPRYTYYFPWCERSPIHIPESFIWRNNLILQWCNTLENGFLSVANTGYVFDEISSFIYTVKKIRSTLQFIGSQINTRAWTMLNLDNILYVMESGIVALNTIQSAIKLSCMVNLADCYPDELNTAHMLLMKLNVAVNIIYDLNNYNRPFLLTR